MMFIVKKHLYKKQNLCTFADGELPEWSIGAVSKTVDPARDPRVRIPHSPHFNLKPL